MSRLRSRVLNEFEAGAANASSSPCVSGSVFRRQAAVRSSERRRIRGLSGTSRCRCQGNRVPTARARRRVLLDESTSGRARGVGRSRLRRELGRTTISLPIGPRRPPTVRCRSVVSRAAEHRPAPRLHDLKTSRDQRRSKTFRCERANTTRHRLPGRPSGAKSNPVLSHGGSRDCRIQRTRLVL